MSDRRRSDRGPRPHAHGHTLIEATIALAIGAVVLAVVAGLLSRTVTVRRTLTTRSADLTEVRTTLLTLSEDLTHARAGSLEVVRAPADDSAIVHIERRVPIPATVRYELHGGRLVIRHRPHFRPEAPAHVSTVLTDVTTFDVDCWSDGRWRPTWRARQAPAMIRVTVAQRGGQALAITTTPPTGDPS